MTFLNKLIEMKPRCTLVCPESCLRFWFQIKMSKALPVSDVALSLILRELTGYIAWPQNPYQVCEIGLNINLYSHDGVFL